MKTYGEKPIVFKFPGDENEYMIGSEVGNYMRLFRGALYKRFPALTRRNMTVDERKKLVEMGHSNHVSASSISLLLAKEVEDLLFGNEEKYKAREMPVNFNHDSSFSKPKSTPKVSLNSLKKYGAPRKITRTATTGNFLAKPM